MSIEVMNVKLSLKSSFKDPINVQLEGIKKLYDYKVFVGKFGKHEIRSTN